MTPAKMFVKISIIGYKKLQLKLSICEIIPRGIMKQAKKCAAVFHLDNEKNNCIAALWNHFFEAA